MSLKSTLLVFKKVAQVVQIGGKGGGGNLDKIQKNCNFSRETVPYVLCWIRGNLKKNVSLPFVLGCAYLVEWVFYIRPLFNFLSPTICIIKST